MIRQYALAVSYSDGSGILRTFGPYPTEDAAKTAEPGLRELYEPDSFGTWAVVPLFSVTIAPATEHAAPKGG